MTERIVPGVYKCIANVSADLAKEGIAKASKNVQQGYAFRGIDAVMNALAPLLAKHGLVILPRMLSREQTERQTQKGGVLFSVTVEMQFDFVCAADGSLHTVTMFGEAMDSADKATNKSATAAYKYACFQAFCIPTEGDNDADAHTPEVVATVPVVPITKPLPVGKPPEGYEEFAITWIAVAETGLDALRKLYAGASVAHREQLTKRDVALYERGQKLAEAADAREKAQQVSA